MNKEELRIGNWVLYKGHAVRLTLDDFSEAYRYYNEESIDGSVWFDTFIKPTPLTEEWLERFGFHGDFEGWTIPQYVEFDLCIDNTGDKYNVYIDGTWITDVQYAHQLQNLYFALCGQELKTD